MPLKINKISVEEQDKITAHKLNERLKINLSTDNNNPENKTHRAIALQFAKEDFNFFCNNFCFIQDPEASNPEDKEIPFLLYDFQEQAANHIIRAIQDGYDLPIEKTRKMGLSWLLMAILIWGWHFHQWDCLVGSQKAENVDKRGNMKALLVKARYIISMLPDWMITPLVPKIHDKNMALIHPKHGSSLAGESNNTNFGRSDRRKVILFDEFSSWEQTDKAAWQSCSSTTKCRIPLSTPNTRGTNCHFYTVCQNSKKKNQPLLRLHWPLHPIFSDRMYIDPDSEKPRSPWYDAEVERASSFQEIAQELDINYEASMGGKVFPMFEEAQIVPELTFNPELPMFYSWDFGLDQTAIVFWQVDHKERTYNIIDEYVNDGDHEGRDIFHYLDILDAKGYPAGVHYGDPQSGENRSLTSGTSNANILRRNNIIFKCQKTRIVNRVNAARNLIKQIRIAPKCSLTIEMFRGWQLVKPKTGNISSDIPKHDEYSHIGEAVTYFCFMYNNQFKNKSTTKRRSYKLSPSGTLG